MSNEYAVQIVFIISAASEQEAIEYAWEAAEDSGIGVLSGVYIDDEFKDPSGEDA